MSKHVISDFVGSENMTIVDAMERIDKNAKGILFVVNQEDSLIGCVTDGDIRRWLLKTGDLNAKLSAFMNTTPKYLLREERARAEAVMKLETITALPITDRKRRILDVVLSSDVVRVEVNEEKIDLSGVPVVVMAGGKGTRLYPYTKILPKPLIPIGETPILERILDVYCEYGIDKYYMTINYKGGMIRSYFTDLKPNYEIEYVEETKPLGTGGSIKLIPEKFDRPLFVTNCDALILANYGDIYDCHIQSGNDITMVSALKNIVVPYGVIHSKENGELDYMEEKPKLSYLINTGMYVINPETIDLIPDDTFFHMTHLVEAVIAKGGKVGIYPVSEDSFLDMGEFDEMKRMEEKLNIVEK